MSDNNIDYNKKLIEFMNYLEGRFTEESNSSDKYPDRYSVKMIKGRRFDKIVYDNKYDFNYIHCFVERNTGNIYKPASWRGPNTKGNCIRGSIYEKESFKNADRFGGWLYLESSNVARWHR